MQGNLRKAEGNKLITIIGDEDTVVGFLLAGIGEKNSKGDCNFLIVDEKTTQEQVQKTLKRFINDPMVGVILLTQEVSEKFVKLMVQAHTQISPVILEIPSKEMKYDPKKDIVMQRAHRLLFGTDIS